MAENDKLNRHQIKKPVDDDLTLRLRGPHFEAIKTWADEQNVSEIFEAVALTFGFNENFTIIGNLSRELSSSDSVRILTQWTENLYIYQLNRLITAYGKSTEISSAFAGIPQGVSRGNTKNTLRAAGADIKHQHFLLEMIVHPLAISGSGALDHLRRTLRIWLIVQAIARMVEHSCFYDSQIQQVASALSLSGENSKWGVIDSILEMSLRECPSDRYSYEQFTLAIRHAATQSLARYSDGGNRKQLLLVKAIQRVAEGQRNPTTVHNAANLFKPSFAGLITSSDHHLILDERSSSPQILAYSDSESDSADEDELEQLILFDVDPGETPEQQQLTGRSILMQTSELSHYLPWSWDKPVNGHLF